MLKNKIIPIDQEIKFDVDETIVSKTDVKGEIKYANDVFCRIAELSEEDVIGKPHNIIRHPDMPRSIFYYLWETIQSKKEIFAYVKNMSGSGKYYWVFAHVTPSLNDSGEIIGYHSSRRCPENHIIPIVSELYKKIKEVEDSFPNRKEGLEAGKEYFLSFLKSQNKTYEEFIWTVGE